jgi:hypothetical protein
MKLVRSVLRLLHYAARRHRIGRGYEQEQKTEMNGLVCSVATLLRKACNFPLDSSTA